MSNQLNQRTYTVSLTAGVERSIDVAGAMFHIVEASAAFDMTFDDSNRFIGLTQGVGNAFQGRYSRIKFKSATTQTVKVVLGFGDYRDSRASVTATINTTIAPSDTVNNPGDVAAGAAATLAIAANANRKEVELCVPSDQPDAVRVGNASVSATSGSIIEPGCSKVFGCEAALYVVRTGSTDITVTVLELERP